MVAPDGARVALLSRDGTVAIHGAVDGVLLARLQTAAPGEGQRWAQRTVAFALDGARLVVACGNQSTELWDLELEQRVAELTLQVDVPVRRLALSRDRRWLAIGDERGNVGVFDARDGAQRGERAKVPGGVSALAFDPDAKLLAIGSEDCRARIFQIETGAVLRELSHCDQDVFGDMAIGDVRFSPDGRTLVTTSYSYWEARAWDLFSGKQLWSHDYGGGSPDLPSATFSPDGELVLLTVNGVVLDARKGSVRHVLAPDGGALNAWVFTDGRFAWQREDDRLQVHAVASGELLFERDLAAEEVAPSHE